MRHRIGEQGDVGSGRFTRPAAGGRAWGVTAAGRLRAQCHRQCLRSSRSIDEVERLVITASGGPFRTWSRDDIDSASVEAALAHPTWTMGRKITIDSASLMNKALEVIEAHWLFGLPAEQIDVIVHPQSIVHSFVEFVDGSVLAVQHTQHDDADLMR